MPEATPASRFQSILTFLQDRFQRFLQHRLALLAAAGGIVLLFTLLATLSTGSTPATAAVASPQLLMLITALALLIASGLLLRTNQDTWLAAALAVGLVLLPQTLNWSVWLMLIGLTDLWMVLRADQETGDIGALLPVLMFLPAAGGVLLTSPQNLTPDTLVLGFGLLVTGSLLSYAPAASDRALMTASTSTGQPVRSITRPVRIPGMESKPATLSRRDLMQQSGIPAGVSAVADRIRFTVDGMIKAAQAIKEMTGQQITGASEQVDVIRMNNQLLETFLALAERANQYMRTMTRAAQEAESLSENGEVVLGQASARMSEIRAHVNAVGQTIVQLAQLTRRIDTIITSVSEIATQSNLLALNASIEAARAGVHGRGFAVVADEVRSLSQQSTEAAKQVRLILAEIQGAVRQTIDAAEAGTIQVDLGAAETRDATDAMHRLAENVQSSYQTVRSIAEIIREQTNGMEAVAIDMERLDRITQQQLVSTRVVEQVSQNLLRLADDLEGIVEIAHVQVTAPV